MLPAWSQKIPELDAVELEQKEAETFIAELAEILYKMSCQFDSSKDCKFHKDPDTSHITSSVYIAGENL